MQDSLVEYTVRISKKAKRAQLKYTAEHGLSVIIPERLKFDVEQFVRDNQSWVSRQVKKFSQYTEAFKYPTSINLACIQKEYLLEYINCNKKIKITEKSHNHLVVYGRIDQKVLCEILQKWLLAKAKDIILPMLDSVSKNICLSYENASIRKQRTIWGSCSYDKNISLNYKLALLPKKLVEYILIHELCHTKYLDHSDRFWKLVEQHDPNYLEHKRQLKIWQMQMPTWLMNK